jgi:molybdenum cofactor guanylyltransferase
VSTPSPVAGFVLAGGRSSRMGRDKATLDWHGQPLLQHMTELLRQVADTVQVVGRDALPDRRPNLGPLEGIATALGVTSTDHNLIVAVDLPLLTVDFLKYFKQRSLHTKHSLTVCNLESGFPLCLGVHKNLKDALDTQIARGNKSVRGFARAVRCEFVTVAELMAAGFSEQLFLNINTDEEYRAAWRAYKP